MMKCSLAQGRESRKGRVRRGVGREREFESKHTCVSYVNERCSEKQTVANTHTHKLIHEQDGENRCLRKQEAV
jgi:hypothetical protein